MRRLASYLLLASCIYCAAPAFASDITDSAGLGSPGSSNYSQVPVDWENIRNKPPTATRWPTWNEIRNEYGKLPIELIEAPDGFLPAEHDHDDLYLKHTGGSMSGQLTMNHHLRINSSTLRLSQGYFRATINSQKDLEDSNHSGFMIVDYNNYVPDGYGMPNTIVLRSNDYYGRPRTGVLSFQRNNRDENGERLYPALAGNPNGDVHLADIISSAWDEDAPPKLNRDGEMYTAYHRTAARILFQTDGAWTDESKGSKIDFYTRPKNPENSPGRRLRINSNGAITLGASSAAPTHQLYLSDGPEEDVARGINIHNGLYIGESGDATTGADIRMAARGHLFADTIMHFTTGSGRFMFRGKPAGEEDYSIVGTTVLFDIRDNGNIYSLGTHHQLSDARFKTDISPLTSSLARISEMRPVSFRWLDASEADSNLPQIGFIAQEVQAVFPELVDEDEETGILSVSYSGMVAPLVGSIKELNNKINDLEQKHSEALSLALKTISALEERVLELESAQEH